MKTIHSLAAAAGILLALAGPSLAASQTHHSAGARSAYARATETDRSGAYYYGPNRAGDAYGAASGAQGWGASGYSYGAQQTPAYPGPEYGEPNGW